MAAEPALFLVLGADPSKRKRLHTRTCAWSRRIFAQENKVNTFHEIEGLRVVSRRAGEPKIGARIATIHLPSPQDGSRSQWRGCL